MTQRTAMLPLLRKDWRLFRAPLIASMVALLMAYAGGWEEVSTVRYATLGWRWGHAIHLGAEYGLYATAVMAAVFAGVSFAAERKERWADFLAMLPPTPGRVLLSKLLVAGACLGTMALLNVAIIAGCWWQAGAPLATIPRPMLVELSAPLAGGLMLFGAA